MTKVKVVIKVKPRSKREININMKEQWQCAVSDFNFDQIFDPTRKNCDVYQVINPIVESCKNGYNATIFTYGQALSGKTYTMMGTDADPGLKVLAIRQLMQESTYSSTRRFIIRVGYMEVLDEKVYDLLNRRQLAYFSRNSESNVKLTNKEIFVKDEESILQLLDKGNKQLTLKPTEGKRNNSIIVHTVLQIIIESQDQAVEDDPVRISCLNFVDLNGSEGSLIKTEKGNCVDKSFECLGLAFDALSNGNPFENCSRSKLTRILTSTFMGNANIAIICNIVPTVLDQTCNSLSFVDKVKNAETHPVCNNTEHSVMSEVQSDIKKLIERGVDKDSDEIKKLTSIFLTEKEMKHNVGTFKRIVRMRPFLSESLNGPDYKYQMVEMADVYMDSTSRHSRNGVAVQFSDFYLERSGFELNLNMRHYLKRGRNLIGRSDNDEDIDILIDSLECSRKHCSIMVSDTSISLTDLHSSNGTVVNGVRIKGRTIELHVNDMIGIVGYKNGLKLVGNIDAIVYRLCKTANADDIPTFEIDDDEVVVIELSDDEDDKFCYPVKMELGTIVPPAGSEVPPSDAEPPLQYQPLEKNGSPQLAASEYHDNTADADFDLMSYILENFSYSELDGANANSIPIVVDQNGIDNGQHVTNTYQSDVNQLKTDEKGKMQNLEGMQSEIFKLKQENESLKLEIEKFKIQLTETIAEKDKQINFIKLRLVEVENEKNFLEEKNLKHIEELMSHFEEKRRKIK